MRGRARAKTRNFRAKIGALEGAEPHGGARPAAAESRGGTARGAGPRGAARGRVYWPHVAGVSSGSSTSRTRQPRIPPTDSRPQHQPTPRFLRPCTENVTAPFYRNGFCNFAIGFDDFSFGFLGFLAFLSVVFIFWMWKSDRLVVFDVGVIFEKFCWRFFSMMNVFVFYYFQN